MDYDKQIDKIKEIANKILPNQVTVLTGKNGCGKSLVRKLVGFYVADKLGLDKNHPVAAATSLQQRTESRPDFGALSSMMHDDPTNSTSSETFSKIKALFNSCLSGSKRFLIIDEPEIGMGEELVVSLVNWLNLKLDPLPENCHGVLVITHNRYIVKHLKSSFINFDDMTREEWLNREIVPVDFETFEKESSELFHAIQTKLNSKE